MKYEIFSFSAGTKDFGEYTKLKAHKIVKNHYIFCEKTTIFYVVFHKES